MTLRELLNRALELFEEQGVESAGVEAEWLLAHALGKDRIYIYAYGSEQASAEVQADYLDRVRRRTEGVPLQYILGTVDFMGCTLTVDPSVLIPRPETELLAEEALKELARLQAARPDAACTVLDLCTGSGALAIAIAARAERGKVTATDVSAEALATARLNAERNGVADRIHFLQGDLFEALDDLQDSRSETYDELQDNRSETYDELQDHLPAEHDSRCRNTASEAAKMDATDGVHNAYDLIVTNPPYVATDVIEALAQNVREHEPKLALDGGADGLSVIRRLLADAPAHLKPGGLLLMEIGYDQGEAVCELADSVVSGGAGRLSRKKKAYAEAKILQDFAGFDRILVLRAGQ